MATSAENFGREKRKQIKNTCTSVTGIADEVYTDIATHNKWGLKFGRTRDYENVTDWSPTLTVNTRLLHAVYQNLI